MMTGTVCFEQKTTRAYL